MVDSRLEGTVNQSELTLLGEIAKSCIDPSAEKRPSMEFVVKKLEDGLRMNPIYFEQIRESDSDNNEGVIVSRNYEGLNQWGDFLSNEWRQRLSDWGLFRFDSTPGNGSGMRDGDLDVEMSSLIRTSRS